MGMGQPRWNHHLALVGAALLVLRGASPVLAVRVIFGTTQAGANGVLEGIPTSVALLNPFTGAVSAETSLGFDNVCPN